MFLVGKQTFKTEQGVCNAIKRALPVAHEVFFSCGDVLIMVNDKAIAICDSTPTARGVRIGQPRFIQPS